MFIGVCSIDLRLPGNSSLKDKRRVLKSVIARIHNQFNVAVAEVGCHDSWTVSTLGVACISTSAAHAHEILEHIVTWIESNRLDLTILDYNIEIL